MGCMEWFLVVCNGALGHIDVGYCVDCTEVDCHVAGPEGSLDGSNFLVMVYGLDGGFCLCLVFGCLAWWEYMRNVRALTGVADLINDLFVSKHEMFLSELCEHLGLSWMVYLDVEGP